jgi:hypothetical protein
MLEWSLGKTIASHFSPTQVNVSLSEWRSFILSSCFDISSIYPDDGVELANIKWVENMDKSYTQLERCMDNFYQGLNRYMDVLQETATVLEMSEE